MLLKIKEKRDELVVITDIVDLIDPSKKEAGVQIQVGEEEQPPEPFKPLV